MTYEKQPCGQMNKNGGLCKNLGVSMKSVGLPDMIMPCKKHRTDDWERLWGYASLAWSHGKMAGVAQVRAEQKQSAGAAEERLKTNVRALERKVERLTAERDAAREKAVQRFAPAARTQTGQGFQIVEVEGYAYEWTGPGKLAVGDRVRLPGNWLSASGWEGSVTRLGSDYSGALARIVRKLG